MTSCGKSTSTHPWQKAETCERPFDLVDLAPGRGAVLSCLFLGLLVLRSMALRRPAHVALIVEVGLVAGAPERLDVVFA